MSRAFASTGRPSDTTPPPTRGFEGFSGGNPPKSTDGSGVNAQVAWPEKNCKASRLLRLCWEGDVNGVKEMLMGKESTGLIISGAQSSLGYSPLHVAQREGNISIMVLLLLWGAEPDTYNGQEIRHLQNPDLPQDLSSQIEALWDSYRRGLHSLGFDFPDLLGFHIAATKPKPRGHEELSKFIAKKSRLSYKAIKELSSPTEESLYQSVSILLKQNNLRQVVDQWIQEVKEDVINITASTTNTNITSTQKSNSIAGSKISFSPFRILSQKYSINIVIYLLLEGKISKRVYYASDFKKDACPNIYLFYNGVNFQPLVDKEFARNYTTTPQMIWEALINEKKFTEDDFGELLSNYDPSKINELVNLGDKMKTILYATCRSGRVDWILLLMGFDNINVNGSQDQDSGSSPLHVASWNGFTDIVLILIYKGASVTYLNKNKESPLVFSKNLPQEVRTKMEEICRVSTNKNPEAARAGIEHMMDQITYVKKDMNVETNKVSTLTASVTTLPPGQVCTLEKLCDLLKADKPPDFITFKEAFSRFDKKHINDFSLDNKATPFYLACRSGSLLIVKHMAENASHLKMSGAQETRTPDQNTPLHIANWRGHYKVVAYLLTFVEPQPNKRGMVPGVEPEIFTSNGSFEHTVISSKLGFIYQAARNVSTKVDKLRPYWEADNSAAITVPPSLTMLVSTTVDNLPVQYQKLKYLWYEVKGTKTELMDITTSSCLDNEYQKYLAMDNKPQNVDITIYSPPGKGQKVWPSTKWNMDFKNFIAEVNKQKKVLKATQRSLSWYYQPASAGWTSFPYKINQALAQALSSKRATAPFSYTEGNFVFKKVTKGIVDFSTSQVTMTGDIKGDFPIKHERDMDETHMWSYESFDMATASTRFAVQDEFVKEEERIKVLTPGTPEYQKVSDAFFTTIPQLKVKKGETKSTEVNKIVKISKYYHGQNRNIFLKNKTSLRNNHSTNPNRCNIVYTKLLWHGTGSLPPDVIHRTVSGWKPNFASDKNLWGRGCYFASDASYSAGYAYKAPNGNKVLVLAEVLVGQPIQCLENSDVVDVPPGYDSVLGNRHGTWIYVVYDSGRAFPAYAVEWESKE